MVLLLTVTVPPGVVAPENRPTRTPIPSAPPLGEMLRMKLFWIVADAPLMTWVPLPSIFTLRIVTPVAPSTVMTAPLLALMTAILLSEFGVLVVWRIRFVRPPVGFEIVRFPVYVPAATLTMSLPSLVAA